jgi:hypothetical protein
MLKVSALKLVLVSICFLFWGQVAERRAIARNPAQGE